MLPRLQHSRAQCLLYTLGCTAVRPHSPVHPCSASLGSARRSCRVEMVRETGGEQATRLVLASCYWCWHDGIREPMPPEAGKATIPQCVCHDPSKRSLSSKRDFSLTEINIRVDLAARGARALLTYATGLARGCVQMTAS